MRAALKDLPPLILASVSPRRAELLRQLRLDFKVVPAEVAEIHDEQMTARELSQVNAYRKARAVAKKFPDALVLAADTLVYLESMLFGKPATLDEAHRMLEQLQGRTHQVVTGIHGRIFDPACGSGQFRFTNSVGALFGALATTNPALPLSNWTALGGVTEVAPGQFQFTDEQTTNSARRFYRLRSP